MRDPAPTDPRAGELRAKLDAFYANAVGYSAFEQTIPRTDLYAAMLAIVAPTSGDQPMQILELGAGRTGFPAFLREINLRAEFDAQDVTAANLDYLTPLCRRVHIGDASTIPHRYDLVFSTYVFEHVVAPGAFLETVDRLLAPGGWHVIVCPRYDCPGYLCPSLRDRSFLSRWWLRAFLAGSHAVGALDRRPRFWVNAKPSVLNGPWYRDADAVHIVSQRDAIRWHRRQGYRVSDVPLRPLSGWRGFVLNNWLTMSLAFQKPA